MVEAEKTMLLDDACVHLKLTEKPLDVMSVTHRVRSPKDRAISLPFVCGVTLVLEYQDQVLSAADAAEQKLLGTHLSQSP
jgi:hypothetical protein